MLCKVCNLSLMNQPPAEKGAPADVEILMGTQLVKNKCNFAYVYWLKQST